MVVPVTGAFVDGSMGDPDKLTALPDERYPGLGMSTKDVPTSSDCLALIPESYIDVGIVESVSASSWSWSELLDVVEYGLEFPDCRRSSTDERDSDSISLSSSSPSSGLCPGKKRSSSIICADILRVSSKGPFQCHSLRMPLQASSRE